MTAVSGRTAGTRSGKGPATRVPHAARTGLACLTVAALGTGGWAQFAPRSFYDSFPFALGWVSVDGPYNEHLVRDVGGLYLALAALTGAALLAGRTGRLAPAQLLARVAAAAWLVQAVPYTVYHLHHLDLFGRFGQVLNLVTLLSTIAVPLLVLVAIQRGSTPAGRSSGP